MIPEISVIIPVYNSGPYLSECIESVLDQTFQNFELILVNDGSRDESMSIIRAYAGRDQRIRYYSQRNQGQGAARNFALTKASGRYIAFVDSDDIIEKDYLETLYESAVSSGADQVICGFKRFDEKGIRGIRRPMQWTETLDDGSRYVFQYTVGGRIYSRSFLDREGLRFEPGEGMEDIPFNIMANITSGKTEALEYTGYHYRVNPVSTTELYKKQGVEEKRLSYPFVGFEQCIRKIRGRYGDRYDKILCYEIIRGTCGLMPVVCRKSTREMMKRVAGFDQKLITENFEEIKSNDYLRIGRFSNEPFSYRLGLKIYVSAVQGGRLYSLFLLVAFWYRISRR